MDIVIEENVVVGQYDHCEHLTPEQSGTLVKVSVRDEVMGNKVYCPNCASEVLANQ